MRNSNPTSRFPWVDIIRVVAITLIVFMHSPIPGKGTPGPILSGLSFFTAPGIGLFLMISGALVLSNNLPQKDFLKRRFSKVLFPTLFWTLFYIVVSYFQEPKSANDIIRSFLTIPFSVQGHGVLWFMYTLAGLYLLTPILSRWLKSATRGEVLFYLMLWGITLLYPYLKLMLSIKTDETNILYYFSGYVGYFILGYWLKTFLLPSGISRKYLIACVIIIMACGAIVGITKIKYPDVSISQLFWYLSMPVAICSMAYFILLSQVKLRFAKLLAKMAELSFGVYLIHIFIMRSILWNVDVIANCGSLLHIPVIAILTLALSWFAAWCISKSPFSKYIIGV